MKSNRAFLVAIAALTALALAGCGGSKNSASSASAKAPAAPANGRAIEITANDTMKFSVTEIRAKAGEALSVTLVNNGTTPKFSMGHNWLLVAPDTDLVALTTAAASAAAKDYKPEEFRAKIIAATKLLGPKERDTVTFNAPAKPGSYPFICSFPGHFQVGMKGVLIVE
jgi:azurin